MIKLKKIIKEAFGDRKFGEPLPTFTGVMNDYQAGKLYTDKDKPPFKTEKQISESIPDYFRGYFSNIRIVVLVIAFLVLGGVFSYLNVPRKR